MGEVKTVSYTKKRKRNYTSNAPKNRKDYAKMLADQFTKQLDDCDAEWIKEWTAYGVSESFNAVTKRKYHGINALHLMLVAMDKGYTDPRWVTMNQIKDIDGKYHPGQDWLLQKGTKGTYIEYWFCYDKIAKRSVSWDVYRNDIKAGRDPNEFSINPTYHCVFNASCVDGVPELKVEERDIEADDLIATLSIEMKVPIFHDGGTKAFYIPSKDEIHLPNIKSFHSNYAYNATALHELAHATGHESRLNRKNNNLFGSEPYAYEELVAEMASCFMSSRIETEISEEHLNNHKAYIKSWKENITKNPNCLIEAVKDAEKATTYMDYKSGFISELEYKQKTNNIVDVDNSNNQVLGEQKAG